MENQLKNEVKRLPDGTVDFQYYEARARELRCETWQGFGRSAKDAMRRLWTQFAAEFVLTTR